MNRVINLYLKIKKTYKSEDRAEALAEIEEYDVLWSALYSAFEADLSENGWPRNSKFILGEAEHAIEKLIKIAEAK